MADNGAAQNKLGELFVDIGVGGVGKALKSLNSVSATFLMTKNAAVQMAKPIVDVGKKTLGMAVDVGKIGSTLGMAYKDAYKLQYYFKHMNLNEGLINDIERLSEQFNQMRFLGSGALTGAQAQAFNVLGLNPMDYYGGGFEKIQQLIKDVQKRTAGMDRTLAANAVQGIGLNTDWLYAFDRGVFDLSDALSISNEEIEAAITASEDINQAMLSIDKALQSLTITIAPYVSEYAPKLANAIDKYAPTIAENMREYLPPIAQGLNDVAKSIGWLLKAFHKLLESTGQFVGKNDKLLKTLGLLPYTESDLENIYNDSANKKKLQKALKEKNKKIEEEFNAQFHSNNTPNILPGVLTPPMPGSTSNTNTNTITITNNITGQNAAEIARKTSISTRDTIESMLNKYQVHTMPGK